MTSTPTRKDIHLAACAAAKVEGDARRARLKADRAASHEALVAGFKARASRDRTVRLAAALGMNAERRHEAAVARILEKARRGIGLDALAEAFLKVAASRDWRDGFDTTVGYAMVPHRFDLTVAAIAFFTCCPSTKVGTIRNADSTEFHVDGFAMNTHDSCSPVSRAQIDRALLIADQFGFHTALPRAA